MAPQRKSGRYMPGARVGKKDPRLRAAQSRALIAERDALREKVAALEKRLKETESHDEKKRKKGKKRRNKKELQGQLVVAQQETQASDKAFMQERRRREGLEDELRREVNRRLAFDMDCAPSYVRRRFADLAS